MLKKKGALDIPLVDISRQSGFYQMGHIALYRIYKMLGQEGISAMCKAAHDYKQIDELGLEKVCLEVAAEQGKTAEVQEFFDSFVFGR